MTIVRRLLPSAFLHSLQLRLSGALIVLALVTAALAGIAAFYRSYRASYEVQDETLRQIAAYISPTAVVPHHAGGGDDDMRIFVQTERTPPDLKHFLPLPDDSGEGFHDVRHDGDSYRVYVKHGIGGRVVVFQETEYREEQAFAAAQSSAVPLLLLALLTGVLVVFIVRRTLRPLRELGDSLQKRRDDDTAALDTRDLPAEVQGFVLAVNRMLEKIDAAMRQQQRFIADAAHEMRSPLTALSLQAERLAAQPLDNAARAQLENVQQAIRRHRHLLEQLLSLARAQSLQSGDCGISDMQTVFARVLADVLPQAEAKGQDIGITAAAGRIQADETDLYLLVKTLADNAVRYTPEGGRIDLAAGEEAHEILITVEDSGAGIPAAERNRVFDPFYRVLASGDQGSGRGLAIAQTLTRRYHGSIRLCDRRDGQSGLRVEVRLPKAA